MRNIAEHDILQRVIRSKICPTCEFRAPGSEGLGPMQVRPCEPKCAIMRNLTALRDIAADDVDDPLAPVEQQIKDQICQSCELSPTAGDYCTRRFTRTCPLANHGNEVIAALEPIAQKHAAID